MAVIFSPSIFSLRLSSVLSVTFALNSLSHSQLSGGPVDLAHHLPHISATMVTTFAISIHCSWLHLISYKEEAVALKSRLELQLHMYVSPADPSSQLNLSDSVPTYCLVAVKHL